MAISDKLAAAEAWLIILIQARTDIGESGLVQKLTKGTFSGTYASVGEVNAAIEKVENSIIMMERGVY